MQLRCWATNFHAGRKIAVGGQAREGKNAHQRWLGWKGCGQVPAGWVELRWAAEPQTNDWLRCVKLVCLGWTELLGAQSGELGRWCGIVLWEEQSRVFLLGI